MHLHPYSPTRNHMGSGPWLAAGHTSVSRKSFGTLLPGIVCVETIWLPALGALGECSVIVGSCGPLVTQKAV
jgi:hypothetical protein